VTTALFPGTFDPITHGHLDILTRASAMFDRVIVVVGARHDKKTVFSAAERVDLIREAAPGIDVELFDGLIVDTARKLGATVLVRGVRNSLDFEYESQMAVTNRALAPEVDTVLIRADPTAAFISSSLIKEIVKAGGSVTKFVPAHVAAALTSK
jgi:pantetheine-phosphate adenylyltransferase